MSVNLSKAALEKLTQESVHVPRYEVAICIENIGEETFFIVGGSPTNAIEHALDKAKTKYPGHPCSLSSYLLCTQ
jgi:hypothetical protein